MSGVTVSQLDGRVVAVKEAPDNPDAEARLRTEADLLSRLDHPGVIQLVALDEGPPVRLLTGFVGPDSWARQPPTDPSDVIQRLAMVVSIVADLHDMGLAHGSIRAEHVLAGVDGRPVLCGLGDASTDSEEALLHDGIDLATLIRAVSAGLSNPEHEELELVASRLENGTPTRAATHQLDAISRPTSPPDQPGYLARLKPRAPALALGLAVVVGIGAVMGIASGPNRSTPPAASTATAGAELPGTEPLLAETAPASSSTATTLPASQPPPPLSPDAPVLVHEGRRYGLGAPGDVALSGDWSCDGTPTPAILRPATGEVAVFDSWPSPEQVLSPSFLAVVNDAVSLEVDTNSDCHLLRARTRTGSQIITPEFP